MALQRIRTIRDKLPQFGDRWDPRIMRELIRTLELAWIEVDPTATGGDAVSGPVIIYAVDRSEGLSVSAAGASLFATGAARNNTTAGIFWTGVLSSGHPYVNDSGIGFRIRKSSTGQGAQCLIPEWPVFAAWTGLAIDPLIVSQFKYRFSCAVKRHAAGGEIGVKDSADLLSAAGIRGYILKDDAGMWVMERRLTAAGSVENLTELANLSSTVWRRLVIEYVEGDPPTLTFSLDGTNIFVASGDAAMPEYPSSSVSYGPAVTGNIVTADARIVVESIVRAQ